MTERASLSPPRRQPLERLQKLSLFDEWWIAPVAEGEGFQICGTEHSSYTTSSIQRSEIIQERLSEKVLVVRTASDVESKVKLIGRMNEEEMQKWYKVHVCRTFAGGVPPNWTEILRSHMKDSHTLQDKACNGPHTKSQDEGDHHEPNAGATKSPAEQETPTGTKKRGPGRPPGSKNKPKLPEDTWRPKRKPGRPPGSKNKVKKKPEYESAFAKALEEGQVVFGPPKRKPGRPPGSKNKMKRDAVSDAVSPLPRQRQAEGEGEGEGLGLEVVPPKRKRGRPPGAKNKVQKPSQDEWRPKRGPGRPPGSKNKPKPLIAPPPRPKRGPGRPPGSKNKVKKAKTDTNTNTAPCNDSSSPPSQRGRRIAPKHDWQSKVKRYFESEDEEAPASGGRGRRGSFLLSSSSEDEEIGDHFKGNQKEKRKLAEDKDKDGDPPGQAHWTSEQMHALSMAQLHVDPTCNNFWQEVAKQVPGKNADECFSKHFQKHPTPVSQKTQSRTGSMGDRIVAHAPSAAVRKHMKHLRWKGTGTKTTTSKENEGDMDENKQPGSYQLSSQAKNQSCKDMGSGKAGFRRSSRLQANQQSHQQEGMSGSLSEVTYSVVKEYEEPKSLKSRIGTIESLMGEWNASGGQPKTLAAAIVNVLAEAELIDGGEEDGEDDFYFEDDV